MKKLFYLGLFISFSVVLFLALNQEVEVQEDVQAQEENRKSSKELFIGKRSPDKDSISKVAHTPCESLQESLDQIDFNQDMKVWLHELDVAQFDACHEKKFAKRFSDVKEACFYQKNHKENCTFQLVFLRSMIRLKYKRDGTREQSLADGIINQFGQTTPDFVKLEELAGKLLEINNSEPVQKLWGMSKLLSQKDLTKMSPELADEIYARLDPEILSDPSMQDLDLILKTKLDPGAIENYSRETLAISPEDSHAHEILGWSLWKQNRRAEAIESLHRAMKYNPYDPWLNEMFLQIKSPDAKIDSYKGRLRIDVQLQDLFS